MTEGESISGRADALRSAAESVPTGAAVEICTAVEQVRDQLRWIIGDESDDVVGVAHQLSESALAVARNVIAVREALHRLSDYHTGTAAGGSLPTAPAAPAAPRPQTVKGPDGSEYPAAAGWAADIMAPRVRTGVARQKTIGYADGEINQQFTSSNDETWSPAVYQRLRDQGERFDVAQRLKSHVELKIATMMIQRGRLHSEAVINNVPCGSQPEASYRGCHDTLAKFLPEGATLTVHGTTEQGQPYSHTYRGTA